MGRGRQAHCEGVICPWGGGGSVSGRMSPGVWGGSGRAKSFEQLSSVKHMVLEDD